MQWSPQQKKVIETRDKNILVSAAAGSGKTAVLVERIIQKIIKDKKNVDRMLVVTFTNAAASEMRERVLKAIERELELQPQNEHLQKQQSYIHNAHITTIHSFCLNLLREHYLELQLDPGFQVADTNEIELMKGEVLEELLEKEYETAEPEFLAFVNQFMVRNSDKAIEGMILDLYEEAMGYPWPKLWLQDSISIYEVQDEAAFLKTVQFLKLKEAGDELLQYALAKCKHAITLCNKTDGPEKYLKVLEQDYANLQQVLECNDYSRRRTMLQFAFNALPRVGKTEADESLKKQVQELRKQIKGLAGDTQKLYQDPIETIIQDLQTLAPIAKEYVRLALAFMQAFHEKKRSKNIVDFTDFEQYAVQILAKVEDGIVVPTKVADTLAAYYEEVMIDEYQDSNHIQETILGIISKEREGIHNRFMVGDVKQSIYGFRGAMPDLFIEKYNQYTLYGGEEFDEAQYLPEDSSVKIILDKNFRSRNTVLEFTNAIFRQMMSKEFGGIDYDKENQLNVGADYKDISDNDYNCEWLFLADLEQEDSESSEETEGLAQHEMEAAAIAARIQELVDEKHGLQVRDAGTGEYRTAKYSDIVILSRGIDDATYVLHDLLNEQGIPCYMDSKKGYFNTIEIRTILNFLKILDNPRQDIPLAGILKSPVGGFDDEELAVIRVVSKYQEQAERTLYDDLVHFSEAMHQTEGQWLLQNGAIDLEGLEKKIQTFLFLLTEFRNMVNHTSIYDMISIFLERTGYYYYVMAMPGGKRRQINIDMLKERAAAYENGIYKGLFYFIRYIEKMQKINLDMGEASTISETDNTVRIMTIHKSKGLEFPIVFLCNIGKNFNFRDSQGRYVLHHDLGVGFDYLNQETRVRKKTAVKMVLERQLRLDVVQEEIRLLYVACTRAKEKLILVHQPIGEKRIRGLLEAASYQEELLPKALRTSAKSYFDMIGVSMCRNQAFVPIYKELGEEWPVEQALYNQNFYLTVKRIMPEALQEKLLKDVYVQEVNLLGLETMTETKTDSALAQELRERLEYQYPYQAAVESYGKVSVSDIKKISYESEIPTAVSLIKEDSAVPEDTKEFVPTVPAFMQTEGILSAANRGTAYHKVFEWFDYSVNHTAETITEMIDHMQQQGWLSKEERAQIKDNDFLIFAQSDLGHRMQAASQRGMLYREAQFVMGLYQSEIRQYEAFAQTGQMEQGDSLVPEEDETVLMQGIIDAYFIEDDKIVIVDYKTDNVPNLEVLKKHYFVQLALYQRALEQLTEKEVSEKLLYSTKFGTACNV